MYREDIKIREILFRGKRKDNGEWVEGYLFEGNESTWIFQKKYNCPDKIGLNPCKPIEVIPKTIGQYFGKDKNNEKIFECDMLKVYIQGVLQEGYYIVKSIEEFYFDTHKEDSYLRICEYYKVGNIHDNKELLNE